MSADVQPLRLARKMAGLLAVLGWIGSLVADDSLQTAPLAPRSGPAGATMFTALPPEQTGIVAENDYADPRMWTDLNPEFALGAIGTGVAAGDFDNDGRPDIFVVSKTGQSRLFRNLGNWKFEDVTARAGLAREGGGGWIKGLAGGGKLPPGPWTQGASWADVNNDGWLDLYVCRFNAPNLLYINQRDGTFKEEAAARGLALVDSSGLGNFCDYDRDGWLDVYVHTNLLDSVRAPNGQADRLYHNRGDGTFEDVTARAGIAGDGLTHSATWWDYNQDGWPDLYVAEDFAASDKLYRNNRDGTFTNVIHTVLPRMPYSSMGSDTGDVDNDGRIDLLATDMAATSHEKDQRGMASSRELTREDADSTTLAPQILSNTLFLNTGGDRFREGAALAGVAATDWTWSVRFEDLDNDGRLDLHVTNGMIREYNNADLRDRIIGNESPAEKTRIMRDSPVLAERNLAFRNRGDLEFEPVGPQWGLDQLGVSFGAAFADFDGDGDLDIIYANYEAAPTVLRNDCQTGHRAIFALRGTASNRFGVGATVRIETAAGVQVRTLAVGRGYLSSSEPILHFGLGDDPKISRATVTWPSGHVQTFPDLPADRRFTITEPAGPVTKAAPPSLAGLPAMGSAPAGQFTAAPLNLASEETFQPEPQPLLPFRFDRRGPALAVGDLNGDRVDDIVLGGTGHQPAQVQLGSASGFNPAAVLGAGPLDDGPVLVFDADGDGRADLLETRAGANRPANSPDFQPVLYLNDANGGLVPRADALPPLASSIGAASAADYDHDGRLDVFLGARVLPGKYPTAPRSALWHNTGGKFEDVTDTLAPALREAGMVTSALWSDVDGDGWADLLLALEWGGVKYFHNDAGRGFTDWSERAGFAAAGPGWWTSLASADFNGDGRPDYAAGNAGLNTPYRADASHPALLYYGRFGGPTVIVEADYEGDRIYPRATLRALGAYMPPLRRRITKNDEYGRLTLEQVVGADRLAAAQRFAATELRSGVFLSQPDGTYRFSPLPRIAQIAPVQGLVAGDFDGDGRADLYAVQNSYAPVPATGRFDGGVSQLLRGDGRGHFAAVEPVCSGLVVPGDAKALVTLDLDADGWPDFLVSRNNAAALAWRNGGVPGRHSFRVVLQGRAGNPAAIGARVTVELADGTVQAGEVEAGAGYYSQSSAAVFFGWPDGNAPRRVRVRWPDGAATSQDFAAPPPATLNLSAP